MEQTPESLYSDLAPAVLGYLRGRGARDAEDLTGDVFVKVTVGLPRFRGNQAALRRWIVTIAHNRLVDEIRHADRAKETNLTTVEIDRNESTAANDDIVDPELLAALGDLSEAQREVVVLRFIADLPINDVAKIVGKRAGAVKMLQARGLTALQSALASPGA
jgi:RNA polymerase sigma-70 factor (ECF subfamily)